MMAISIASLSESARTTTGTSCRLARCAARQRRSPATISYDSCSPLTGRTTSGCTSPRSRIETASSSICRSEKFRLGLKRPALSASSATLRWPSTSPNSAPSPSPISEARLRPSLILCMPAAILASLFPPPLLTLDLRRTHPPFALYYLGGKPDIGLAAGASIVVEERRLPVRWRLGDPHIARDDGRVDLVAQHAPHVVNHLVGQRRALIVHGEHHPVN